MEIFLCVVTHPFLWIGLGLVGVFYAIQWLVSQKGTLFDITGFIQTSFGLNHVPKYVIRLIWYLWIILFMAMLFSISYALYNIILMISSPDTKLESLSVSAYALPAMVVPLSALIAFPITVLRQHYNRRQTEAEEEGLITDRINAAVASLGANKIVKGPEGKETTEPNIEVRVGAILALERLAQKNDDVHVQIMEILCSYLRENAKHKLNDAGKYYQVREDEFYRAIPRNDLQLAIDVLRRRPDSHIDFEHSKKFRLNLSNCNFAGFDFKKGNFTGALFKNCIFEATNFRDAKLVGARLSYSHLSYLDWHGVDLTGANFGYCNAVNLKVRGEFVLASSIRGLLLYGATLAKGRPIAQKSKVNETFGSKETIESINPLEDIERLESIMWKVDTGQATNEEKKEIENKGLLHWRAYNADDLATSQYINRLWDKLGLVGFPFRD